MNGQCMKESNTFVGNAATKQLQKDILHNTNRYNMEVSNTYANNAATEQLQMDLLLDIKVT